MKTYEYKNKNGHPYLYNTVGYCDHHDSHLVDSYLKYKTETKDHKKECSCMTCSNLKHLENTIVIYNTVILNFVEAKSIDNSSTNPEPFRVKIMNLKDHI